MSEKIHYANPDETTFVGACFEFRFGAYGGPYATPIRATIIRVYQKPGHIEAALELAAEWLAENEPGHFIEPDYETAKDEIMGESGRGDDMIDDEEVAVKAEVDLTYTESGWLTSWEWAVNEIDGCPLPEPTFDRFDVCQAYATYWAANHQGQFSDGYSRMCVAQNLCENAVKDSFDDLTENGQAIYRRLCLKDGR